MIDKDDYATWFGQFWTITGASTRNHPAPLPLQLAYRLVRMCSFRGDTVFDHFCGTGTTMLAAMKCSRNSIGVDIDEDYCRMALHRLRTEDRDLFRDAEIIFSKMVENGRGLVVREEPAIYRGKGGKKKRTRSRANKTPARNKTCPSGLLHSSSHALGPIAHLLMIASAFI
jgi:hypothetical protein